MTVDDFEEGRQCKKTTTPNTIPQLREVVQEKQGKVPLKDVQDVVKSTPKRAELVHKVKGFAPKY